MEVSNQLHASATLPVVIEGAALFSTDTELFSTTGFFYLEHPACSLSLF
jgi:hypothetical protein